MVKTQRSRDKKIQTLKGQDIRDQDIDIKTQTCQDARSSLHEEVKTQSDQDTKRS